MKNLIVLIFALLTINSVNAQQGWNIINSSLFNSDVNKLFFINNEIGFAKTGTEIMKTVDGAVTWSKINLNFNNKLLDFCFINSSIGFIVGDSGIILKTIDGGENWFKLNSGNTFYLNRIRILDTNNVYIWNRS